MKVLNKGNPPSITEVIIGTGELWTPYRDLRDVVERALVDSSPETMDEVQQMLTIHKPDFISLLSCKGCNVTDRQELRNAGGEGAYFKGHEGKQVLPLQLINETMLLSDMFNINEFLALDLLATAETEIDKHPGWGRGLLAVYLFYEGQNAIVQSLLTIIQAIPGNTWSSSVSPKAIDLFKNVFNAVFSGDMMDRLLTNYEKTSEKVAMELLDSNLALGDWRHRSEVSKFLRSIRQGLAQIIFCWCAQHRVSWKETLRLLDFLKVNVTTAPETDVTKDDILLLSSILFCVSNNITESDVDESFVNGFKKYIKDNESATGFHNPELLDFYKLIFYTKAYKAVAETHMSTSRGQIPLLCESKTSLLKADDDFEMKTDVFAFLKNYMLMYPSRYCEEENVMRQYHSLFSDFICYMSIKLKELKNRSEDSLKTAALYYEQGIRRPPNLPQEYENFLECIGLFYFSDTFELALDFFSPDSQLAPLCKFVRSACCDSTTLFIPNTKMLCGLANSFPSGVFALLKETGHNMCIENFFQSMMKYLSSFGVESFEGVPLQRFEINMTKMVMNPFEAKSICCYLDIIEILCKGSAAVKHYFCSSNFPWVKMCFHMGKIRNIPLEIRAKMINVIAAVIPTESGNPEVITNLWDVFYKTKFLDQGAPDLRTELEDRETRDTVYPLTIAFLKMIKALVDARFPQRECNMLENELGAVFDNGAFDPYVAYLCDAILLKDPYRSYKNILDRWTMATLGLNIVSSLLDVLPSFMFQMLCDSPLLQSVFDILRDCVRVREMSTGDIPHVDPCSWQCLSLILRVLQRQSMFLYHRDTLPNKSGTVMIGLHELLTKTISRSGRPESLLAVVKFIDKLNPEEHRYAALEILYLLVSEHGETDMHLYNSITADSNIAVIFRHTLTQMLNDHNCDDSFKSIVLRLIRSSVVHQPPNVAFYLLGVDKKIEFQNPGVQNYPVTLLHALIDNCSILPDAFATLLVLVQDPALWQPLLKYLRNNQFFTNLLSTKFPKPGTAMESIGQFFKVMAVELKTSSNASALAVKFLERRSCKFQDILTLVEIDNQTIDLPVFEFFDAPRVHKAIEACEYYSGELKIKIIRIEMLEALLHDQIRDIEKNVLTRLRKSITMEAKDILVFARQLNEMRTKEAGKMLVFDGWRECLEVIVLSPDILSAVGTDFVAGMLRILLTKVTSASAPSKFFLRLAAETTLTLCAVISRLKSDVSPTTLRVILNSICEWTAGEQSFTVRALLYSCILYLMTMFRNEGVSTCSSSLTLIMDTLCSDSFQPHEVGRMQAMNLVGEILRLTSNRGLDSLDSSHLYKSSLNQSLSMIQSSKDESIVAKNKSISQDFDSSYKILNSTTKTDKSMSESKLNETFSSQLSVLSRTQYSQTSILNHIVVKGFIKKMVDDLSLIDDNNLLQLFSNQPERNNMRAMYAFEVKMTLMCRLAATGSKACRLLIDANLINKLSDMTVFSLNPTTEISSRHMRRNYVSSGLNFSLGGRNAGEMMAPVGNIQTESLFSTVFKLFHVMLCTNPKDERLVAQIWDFLSTHDLAIGSILSSKGKPDSPETTAVSLLTSLMAIIGNKLNVNAINKNHSIYPKLMNILYLYSEEKNSSEYFTRLVRNVITFLCGHSRNKEAVREQGEEPDFRKDCRVVLQPSLQYTENNPQDDVSFGLILKIINTAAAKVSSSATAAPSKLIENLIAIIECGLTLIYFHAEIFLTKNFSEFLSYDQDTKKLRQELFSKAENTAKQISDIIKLIPQADYLEIIILRLRRLQV